MIKKIVGLYSITLIQILYALELKPIVVESSKMNENGLEVANSVDILNPDQLAIIHLNTIQNLSAVLPNTNISGIGNRSDTSITMRGICNYITSESSVAMYIDDAPIPFNYGFGGIDFQNLDRIEVFKGAQGTDFGRNAESGVISIYTKTIPNIFVSEASVDVGNYNSKKFYGRIAGPSAIDKVAFSFSISDTKSNGYTYNELTHGNFDYRHLIGLSAKLKYTPTSYLDIALNYSKTKTDDGGTAFKIDTKNDPYIVDNEPQNDWVKMDNDLLSLVMHYTQNDTLWTSVTSYGLESVRKDDYVGILGGLDISTDTKIEEITQEFRINKIDKNFEYLLGTFYSEKLRFDYLEKQQFFAIPVLNNRNNLDNIDKNIAVFGKIQYNLDEDFSIMSGLRYQKTKRDFTRDYTSFSMPKNSLTTWKHWLPTLSFMYERDNKNIYFTYSKGYRAGGYNYRSSGSELIPYKPENTDSFELGHKYFGNSSWNISNAVFYNHIHDLRTITFDDYLATTTRNADQAYSYGFESTLNYSSDNFNLYGSLGLTKAKYQNFRVGSIDYSGKNLIDVPDITFSLGGKYQFNTNWYSTVATTYMGNRYYDIANTQRENGYAKYNIGIGYNQKKWKAEVYADNIFDSNHVDFMIHTPSHNYYHFNTPRVVGFKLNIYI